AYGVSGSLLPLTHEGRAYDPQAPTAVNACTLSPERACTRLRASLPAWHAPQSTGARTASGARQRPARPRRLLNGIEEAVQVHRGVERGHAALPGADRLSEQRVHLPNVERIAAREVGRDRHEALGDRQVAERVGATRAC